ncbi:MAG: hypothetical protein GWN71_07125, partial [Gammaproteobacteria bacterium]|nr:hypothetical protein [Gemmatimonadota bacterium]NIU73351.1 hypothetical protein [Gammaproteobacteria bacterium]
AVLALQTMATGEPEPTLVVDFQDGRWLLSQDDAPVGELPELATFQDGWALLTAYAAALPAAAPSATEVEFQEVRDALDDFSVRRLAE